MRAKANQFQAVIIGLAVDENEVWLNVAVGVIVPFPGQRVV
jgi:hypothetical protein